MAKPEPIFLIEKGMRYSPPRHRRGRWEVAVYAHPELADKYCYELTVNQKVVVDYEKSSHPTLHGCFSLPFLALKAGTQEAAYGESETCPYHSIRNSGLKTTQSDYPRCS